MIQERQEEQLAISPRAIINRTGLIFALPHPVIYHKNNPYNISSERSQKFESEQSPPMSTLQAMAKKRKKLREKARSVMEMEKPEQTKYEQKSVLRETLYRKFMEKTKYIDGSVQGRSVGSGQSPGDREKDSNTNTNVKLRQMNLVVLSKRQELKREIKNKIEKNKDKEKEKQKSNEHLPATVRPNGTSLPHFARSRSSFYKGQNSEYNTLAFLSKTIFSEIETHFTAHFPKQKKLEPFELGISKAKIVNKNSSRSLKNKRRSQEHSYMRQYGRGLNQQYLRTHVQRKWSKPTQSRNRKRTELKGWEEQLPQYNIPLQ